MWKLLVVTLLTVAAHAEQRGAPNRMEADSQDGEECATAPGNPQSVAECRKAKAIVVASCLSDQTVKKYEASARKAVREVEEAAKDWNIFAGRDAIVVFDALRHGGLITKELERKGGDMWAHNDFVNLLYCAEWEKKLKNEKDYPLGSVLVFADSAGKQMIRMKTPKGCLASAPMLSDEVQTKIGKGADSSDDFQLHAQAAAAKHVKEASCSIPGYTLKAIYVKNVN